MKNKQTQPDAWLVLVLKTMSVNELQHEIAGGTLSADEQRWMRAELARRS